MKSKKRFQWNNGKMKKKMDVKESVVRYFYTIVEG